MATTIVLAFLPDSLVQDFRYCHSGHVITTMSIVYTEQVVLRIDFFRLNYSTIIHCTRLDGPCAIILILSEWPRSKHMYIVIGHAPT